MKQFIKQHLAWLIVEGVFILMTPQMFTYARAERGYDAIGGEMFFPLLPLFVWLLWKTIQDMFKDFKPIDESDGEDETHDKY